MISMKEKAKYLEAARRQVDRSEALKKDSAKVCRGWGAGKWEMGPTLNANPASKCSLTFPTGGEQGEATVT